jgi:hypothetical protein
MLCAAGLAAQTPAEDQKKANEPAKMDEKTVTITGCLRAGDTPNSFVLTNVKTAEATGATTPKAPTAPYPPTPPTEPPSTPPAPPTRTTPPIPATPPSNPEAGATVGTSGAIGSGDVRLVGAPANVDLSKHVGHTVEITGTFVPAGKAARPTGTSGTEGAASADARSFTVKSMAHKSETCK